MPDNWCNLRRMKVLLRRIANAALLCGLNSARFEELAAPNF